MNLGRLLCTVEFVQEQREPLITPFDLTVAFWISTMISFHNNAACFFASCCFYCSGSESSSTPSWSKDAQACLFLSRKASHKAYVDLTEGMWPVERKVKACQCLPTTSCNVWLPIPCDSQEKLKFYFIWVLLGIYEVYTVWIEHELCASAPQIRVLWAALTAVPVRIAIQQPCCPVSCAFKTSPWTRWLPSQSASTSSASWWEALLSLREMEL